MNSKTTLLRGARIVLPAGILDDGALLIEGERIAHIYEDATAPCAHADSVIDLGGGMIFPGFIDVHIHGASGVDTMEATPDDLHRMAQFLLSRGTTAWLPTLVPAPDEDYLQAAQVIDTLMKEQGARAPAARVVGVHYEGPFLNQAMCGALRTPYFRTYTGTELKAIHRLQTPGAVHMTTLAPEIEGGIELVRELHAQGWIISIGHTRAEIEVLDAARASGASHMTHFMNAMSGLHHREPGVVGWGLMHDDVTCDVIADGIHVDPLALRLILRCKKPERVALISDAVAPTGVGDGEYRMWGETITVDQNRTSNSRGSIAGSVITMCDAVKMMLSLGVSAPDIARMAATNPARLLLIDEECGSIEEGKRADLVAMDDNMNVTLTFVGGCTAK